MSDIVERLRSERKSVTTDSAFTYALVPVPLCIEAADEIERLTRELADAREKCPKLIEALTGENEELRKYNGDLRRELAEAKALVAEARALSLEWMACHDKLKAGKPYKFPSPPYDRALIEARNTAIEEAAKVADEHEKKFPSSDGAEIATAIRALVKP